MHSKVPRFGPGDIDDAVLHHISQKIPRRCPHCRNKWSGIEQKVLVGKKYMCATCTGYVVIPRRILGGLF